MKNDKPAYPHTKYTLGDEHYGQIVPKQNGGLTRREVFAKAAMQGLLSNPGGPIQENPQNGWGFTNCNAADVAFTACELTDALIAELDKEEGA